MCIIDAEKLPHLNRSDICGTLTLNWQIIQIYQIEQFLINLNNELWSICWHSVHQRPVIIEITTKQRYNINYIWVSNSGDWIFARQAGECTLIFRYVIMICDSVCDAAYYVTDLALDTVVVPASRTGRTGGRGREGGERLFWTTNRRENGRSTTSNASANDGSSNTAYPLATWPRFERATVVWLPRPRFTPQRRKTCKGERPLVLGSVPSDQRADLYDFGDQRLSKRLILATK